MRTEEQAFPFDKLLDAARKNLGFGKVNAASQQLRKAILIEPTSKEATTNFSISVYSSKYAEQSFRKNLILYPKDGKIRANFIKWLQANKKFDACRNQCLRSLILDPQDASALGKLLEIKITTFSSKTNTESLVVSFKKHFLISSQNKLQTKKFIDFLFNSNNYKIIYEVINTLDVKEKNIALDHLIFYCDPFIFMRILNLFHFFEKYEDLEYIMGLYECNKGLDYIYYIIKYYLCKQKNINFIRQSIILMPNSAIPLLEYWNQFICKNKTDFFFARRLLIILKQNKKKYITFISQNTDIIFNNFRNKWSANLIKYSILLSPKNYYSMINYATFFIVERKFICSERYLRLASCIKKTHHLYANLFVNYRRKGQPLRAMKNLNHAILLNSNNNEYRYYRSSLNLALGNTKRGFSEYDSRFHINEIFSRFNFTQNLQVPIWSGEPLQSKKIIIWGEQGLGDEIWCFGYLSKMGEMCTDIYLECSPKLKKLVKRNFPDIKIIVRTDKFLFDEKFFDFQIPLGSLPKIFALPQHQNNFKYFVPKSELVYYLREKYRRGNHKKIIGISWRSIKSRADYSFEIPLSNWLPLLQNKNYKFVSIQYGDIDPRLFEKLKKADVDIVWDPDIDNFGDLDAAAAQISALDAVVSIANLSIMLAHSVGVPCWAALREYQEDWRYRIGSETSPWLPLCTHIWKKNGHEWPTVFETINSKMDLFFDS